jgi:hypothetical protein
MPVWKIRENATCRYDAQIILRYLDMLLSCQNNTKIF